MPLKWNMEKTIQRHFSLKRLEATRNQVDFSLISEKTFDFILIMIMMIMIMINIIIIIIG